MKQVLIITMVLGVQDLALAQDWQAYLPLRVGNAWEYAVTEPTSSMRREVVGTQEVGDTTFYEVLETWGGATIRPPRTFYARYDTAGVVTFTDSTAYDTVSYPRPFPAASCSGCDFQEWFDLRWVIGDTVYVGNNDVESYYISESPSLPSIFEGDTSWSESKCMFGLAWHECYLQGAGLISAGSLESFSLTYARIDGISYGKAALSADRTELIETLGIDIYPNPVKDHVFAQLPQWTGPWYSISVMNMLGQQVLVVENESRKHRNDRLELDVSSLPNGVYLLTIIGNNTFRRTGSFVIAR